jgi:cytochrome b involved in lipid metabolism
MEKINLFILMVSIVFLGGCFHKDTNSTTVNESNKEKGGVLEKNKGIVMEEVIKHDNKNDCWLLIDGKVYDVTEFIGSHPGGKAILEGCGKDATELFETRPMGSGVPHSDRARGLREDYYIGNLK